jgi:hypothetical protein
MSGRVVYAFVLFGSMALSGCGFYLDGAASISHLYFTPLLFLAQRFLTQFLKIKKRVTV